jgi:hypothetical protein
MPCDCFLFPELKMALKGKSFNDITMVEAKLWHAHAKFQTVKLTNA